MMIRSIETKSLHFVVSNGPNALALSDGRVCNIGRKMTGTGKLKIIGDTPTPMPLSTINPAMIAPEMKPWPL